MSESAKVLLDKVARHWGEDEPAMTTGPEPVLVAEADAIAEDEPPFDDAEPGFCARVGSRL